MRKLSLSYLKGREIETNRPRKIFRLRILPLYAYNNRLSQFRSEIQFRSPPCVTHLRPPKGCLSWNQRKRGFRPRHSDMDCSRPKWQLHHHSRSLPIPIPTCLLILFSFNFGSIFYKGTHTEKGRKVETSQQLTAS